MVSNTILSSILSARYLDCGLPYYHTLMFVYSFIDTLWEEGDGQGDSKAKTEHFQYPFVIAKIRR
jgi:hypothetical protein